MRADAAEEDAQVLSVLCWNILAQCYMSAHPPPHTLSHPRPKPAHRRKQTMQTLKDADATLVALQEVDCAEEFWQHEWHHQLGYQSDVLRRPRKKEGLALLWKPSVIRLIGETNGESENEKRKNRFCPKSKDSIVKRLANRS